jgi:hypothetical protein
MRQQSIQNNVYKIVRRKFFDNDMGYYHDYLCSMFTDTMYYNDWVLYWVTNNTRKHATLSTYYKHNVYGLDYGYNDGVIEEFAFFRLLIIEDFINYLSQKQ